MKFRNSYPTFDGEFSIEDSPEDMVVLKWVLNECQVVASVDLNHYSNRIVYYDGATKDSRELRV
jgi:hypothetical protein